MIPECPPYYTGFLNGIFREHGRYVFALETQDENGEYHDQIVYCPLCLEEWAALNMAEVNQSDYQVRITIVEVRDQNGEVSFGILRRM